MSVDYIVMAEVDPIVQEAYNYATKRLCEKRGYDYGKVPGTDRGVCKHNKETCERDHGKSYNFRPELAGGKVAYVYGEWDERSKQCRSADATYKNFCLKNRLTYTKDPNSGVGFCSPNLDYCRSFGTKHSPWGPVDITRGWEPYSREQRTDHKLITQELNKPMPDTLRDNPDISLGDCYVDVSQFLAESITGKTIGRNVYKSGGVIGNPYGRSAEEIFDAWPDLIERRTEESNYAWLNRINNAVIDQNSFEFKYQGRPEEIEEHYDVFYNGANRSVTLTKVNEGLNKGKVIQVKIR